MIKRYLPYIAAITSVSLWASAYPFARYAFVAYSPRGLILARFLLASITLLSVNLAMNKGKLRLPEKVDMPWFVICSFFGVFVYTWLFHEGLERVDAGVSSFIMAFNPVVVMILSVLVLKEPLRRRMLVGVIISFSGLVLVTLTQAQGFDINPGVFMLLAAACFIAILPILQRRLLKKYTPIETSSYTVAIATIFMIGFAPEMIQGFLSSHATVHLSVLYLGVLPIGMGFFFWGFALSRVDNTLRVTNMLYLMPFIASLAAYFVLGETLSVQELLGGVIIITGVLLGNSGK